MPSRKNKKYRRDERYIDALHRYYEGAKKSFGQLNNAQRDRFNDWSDYVGHVLKPYLRKGNEKKKIPADQVIFDGKAVGVRTGNGNILAL